MDLFAAGPELAANALAFVVADGADRLLTTRRVVQRWQDVDQAERLALFALIDQLGVNDGSLRFELETAGRWYMRIDRGASVFAGLPGFSDNEEQRLLPALRHGLERAQSVDFVAAFLQPAGVALLRPHLVAALRRGARVRILTGDYYNITSPAALRGLLELTAEFSPAMKAAIYQCAGGGSFHAKAYIFASGGEVAAYVGSSNISRSALTSGVEWNLRALSRAQAGELAAICAGFERLWNAPETERLTEAWVDAYERRPRPSQDWDPPPVPSDSPPQPHVIQLEALAALHAAMAGGARRGLVVLATGLGKTLLAAFAAREIDARRVLFLAHREEILEQAMRAFARVLPERSRGMFMGQRRDRGVELLFATVQTLGRHLSTWPKDHFDFVIVDEFHHAAASSYLQVIEHFTPRFMLGLTATPERGDGADLLALCEGRRIHRAGLVEGIARKRLVPFTYLGVKDDVDYQAIRWRNGRFDPDALDQALLRGSHAEQALAQYLKHAGPSPRRGLWFCASIAHADYMAAFLTRHGIATVAVHSGATGAPRRESLRRLGAGELQAIAAVDVFNEGVDVPDVDVVVLLRPTESKIVFMQQIGRGLRLPERSLKSSLLILDFIGNHDSFLRKPQALSALLGKELSRAAATRALLDQRIEVPEGCQVRLDPEVIELLRSLSRQNADDTVLEAFMHFRDMHERRPQLAELVAEGIQGRKPAAMFGSWWDLLARLGELDPAQTRVWTARAEDLVALEAAKATEAAPWAALLAWIERGGPGHPVPEGGIPGGVDSVKALLKLWPRALVLRDGQIELQVPVAASDRPVLIEMIEEVAAARIAEAEWVVSAQPSGPVEVLDLILNGRNPILWFPPQGSQLAGKNTDVSIEGKVYSLRGKVQAVNVIEPGGPDNPLPRLLRRMFGMRAGKPGTLHQVELRNEDGQWSMRPRYATSPVSVPFYAELAVACGVGDIQHEGADEVRTLRVHSPVRVAPGRALVVRASGDSMDGGDMPIRDGDLVLCARLDSPPLDAVEHEICLLAAYDGPEMSEAMIKIPTRAVDGSWTLRSTSKGQADLAVDRWKGLRVVARVIAIVHPVDSSDR